jgi:hypothetical protein
VASDDITLNSLGSAAEVARRNRTRASSSPLDNILEALAAYAPGISAARSFGVPADIVRGANEEAQRAFEEAGSLQRGGSYNAGPVTRQALGAIGAPAIGPATTVATLGSGLIRRPPLVFPPSVRASAADITRAAAESQGMTQPQLRQLYRDLGLTGQEPLPLVQKSLGSQPAEEVARATALKMEDRAALDKLTPDQRLAFQKGEKIPGFMLPSQEEAQAGKAAFAPTKKEITRAEKAFDAATKAGQGPEPIFNLSEEALRRPPDVEQFPLPRVAPKMTERLEPAFAGGGGLRRIERAAGEASPRDWFWYNIQEPLGTFSQVHGRAGPDVARTWVDALSGTSMVNPIESNVRGSSYYLGKILRGEPLPQSIPLLDPVSGKTVKALAGPPPAGYGAKAQIQHADRVREYIANLADPVANPKPFSYRQNLGGNYMPRTIDTHDIRNMVGMPTALKTFGEEGALLPGEYATLENLGARAAERAGMPQAMQQGATWIGGAPYTALKSQPIPLVDVLNRRAQVTAAVRGETPWEAWIAHVSGQRPLLSGGAVPLPAGSDDR